MLNNIFESPKKNKKKREPVSKSQKNEVFDRQKGKCNKCKKRLELRAIQYDHIKEVSMGGRSSVNNLQALCSNCHSKKTHKHNLKKTEKNKSKNRKINDNSLLPSFDISNPFNLSQKKGNKKPKNFFGENIKF